MQHDCLCMFDVNDIAFLRDVFLQKDIGHVRNYIDVVVERARQRILQMLPTVLLLRVLATLPMLLMLSLREQLLLCTLNKSN